MQRILYKASIPTQAGLTFPSLYGLFPTVTAGLEVATGATEQPPADELGQCTAEPTSWVTGWPGCTSNIPLSHSLSTIYSATISGTIPSPTHHLRAPTERHDLGSKRTHRLRSASGRILL